MVETAIIPLPGIPEEAKVSPKDKCEQGGGTWDEQTQTCIPKGFVKTPDGKTVKLVLPSQPPKVEEAPITTPEVFKSGETGRLSGVTLPGGRTFLGLSPDEVAKIVERESQRGVPPPGSVPVGTAQAVARQQAAGAQLAGQVGQIQPSTGIIPTDLSQDEAIRQGVVSSIPRALSLAGGGAALGFAGAKVGAGVGTAITPVIGTAIGAATGLAAGLAAGFISNLKSQRTDTTNAQQRVLDEGKQTLMDWVTLAKSDPANRNLYLSQFNIQLQAIQNAHVEMLTDTNADIAKFETAIPNLAEFNSFYSLGGERDALVQEMQFALQTPSGVEWEMLQLAQRKI